MHTSAFADERPPAPVANTRCHLRKLGAWYLLMYISFILVAALHKPQEKVR